MLLIALFSDECGCLVLSYGSQNRGEWIVIYMVTDTICKGVKDKMESDKGARLQK